MNKKYILSKNEDIQDIIKNGKKIVTKYFIIYYRNTNISYNKFCISVSKRLGKANIRNLHKRRIKDILMKKYINKDFNNFYNYVIIIRNSILDLNYNELQEELLKTLKGVN